MKNLRILAILLVENEQSYDIYFKNFKNFWQVTASKNSRNLPENERETTKQNSDNGQRLLQGFI